MPQTADAVKRSKLPRQRGSLDTPWGTLDSNTKKDFQLEVAFYRIICLSVFLNENGKLISAQIHRDT
jgi:hypothetical protein